jgi:hypothetical protein
MITIFVQSIFIQFALENAWKAVLELRKCKTFSGGETPGPLSPESYYDSKSVTKSFIIITTFQVNFNIEVQITGKILRPPPPPPPPNVRCFATSLLALSLCYVFVGLMDIGRITQAYTALKIKSLDEQVGKLAISQSHGYRKNYASIYCS